MDEQSQIQAIIDRLAGRPGVRLPPIAALDEPWRSIYLRVQKAGDITSAERQLFHAARDLPGGTSLAEEVLDRIPSADIFAAFPSLLEMDARFPPVSWLWPSWVPRGMLTILGAAPGAGKSLLALDLARRVIEGLPFPDGAPPARRGRVLIVDAEGVPSLLRERARAWAFDRHRLFLMLTETPDNAIDLSAPDCQEALRRRCYNLQPELVVVDSLAAATSRGETSLEGARTLLAFLSSLAHQFEMGLLVIHHLRKRSSVVKPAASPPGPDELRGSSHLSAAARSILTLSLCPGPSGALDPNGPRRLEVVKTNLCLYPPPLRLTLEPGPASVPTLRFDSFPEGAPPPGGPLPTRSRECADWLLAYLAAAGEPVRPRDVIQAARQAGFSPRTLYRARRALEGDVVDVGSGPRDPDKRWGDIVSGKTGISG
jgi:hypothetical protein